MLTPVYSDAASDELESIRLELCGDPMRPCNSHTSVALGRALWNEIHRLRTVNEALYEKRESLELQLEQSFNKKYIGELMQARDEARAEVINLTQANVNQSNEIMRLRGLPYNQSKPSCADSGVGWCQEAAEGLGRCDGGKCRRYGGVDADPEEWTLHDKYVQSILPECLRIAAMRQDAARNVGIQAFGSDDEFRTAIVTEARAIADAAMKARTE